MKLEQEKICVCGCSEQMHIDCTDQCFHGDCGCKEFEENDFQETEEANVLTCPYCTNPLPPENSPAYDRHYSGACADN